MHPEKLDFVIPVFNEEESLKELFKRIKAAVEENGIKGFKVIFIDDGSTDKSWEIISELKKENPDNVKGLSLRINRGKAFALDLGFHHTDAPVVFTMDADLQDDPKEIPKFLEKLDEYDLVSGWKQRRNDPIDKTLPSKVFNFVLSRATRIKLHDFNCGFKCYKAAIIKKIRLYGELHRFTPVLASFYGYKIAEVSVEHHARKYGKSKYGFERFAKGLVDLCSVIVFTRFSDRPAHLLGGLGLVSGGSGFLILCYLTAVKFIFNESIGTRPLLLLGVLLMILSIQLISIGIVSELVIRNSALHRQDADDFVKVEV